MEETWTILKVLQWTTGYFSRKGIDQPRANAEVLLAHTLRLERIQLYLRHDQPLSPVELARYRELVQRRAAREPTQYITGKQEFWSLELEVTPAVLIPRPETEVLVETALEVLGSEPARILDLGTGSGAIAIAIAHECPNVQVVATDCSAGALAVAARNVRKHKLEDRIALAAMAFFDAFTPRLPPFDLIVSNPPYIGENEFPDLAPEVSRFEPSTALLGGGAEGLDTIRRILTNIPDYLKPGGTLLFEIGQGQVELLEPELRGIMRADAGGTIQDAGCDLLKPGPNRISWVASFSFIKDYSGILRIARVTKTAA